MSLDTFLAKCAEDRNHCWRTSSGELVNCIEEAVEQRDELRELIRRHATGDITADELHALANVWPCEHRALQEPPDDGVERLEVCAKCGLTL